MSEATLGIVLTRSEGRAAVLFDDGTEVSDMAALVQHAPALAGAAHAVELAQAANHFAQGDEFSVITDPAGFAQDYRRRLASEDPAAPWDQNVVRLGDFGMADLAAVAPPSFDGRRLVFWTVDLLTGLPYRAETDDLARAPDYAPIAMSPLPASASPAPPADEPGPESRPVAPPEPEDLPA